MRTSITIIAFFVALILFGFDNQRDMRQKKALRLFNGKDIKDWIVKIHHYDVGENFGNTFRVEDGMIKVRYDKYGAFNDRFAHLYYKTPFSHFKLLVEYRFTGEL